MPLVLAGIDEAGYGPRLGPLCVGMTAFRVECDAAGAHPCLWKLLRKGVCKKPSDRRRRVAVDDSKRLKGPNDRATRHPLAELERGVLGFLACLEGGRPSATDGRPSVVLSELAEPNEPSAAEPAAQSGQLPLTCADLFARVGSEVEQHAWHVTQPQGLPVSMTPGEVGIAANMVRGAMSAAGVSILEVRCRTIGEARFNAIVEHAGSKSAAVGAGITRHLRRLWDHHAGAAGGGVHAVCDAQGGRTHYGEYLSLAIPGATVTVVEESPALSRYVLRGDRACPRWRREDEPALLGEAPCEREMAVSFMPEAEGKHLPVALASMLAKFVRELMMARFNRYWCGRFPDVKPTAGYNTDAWRWLRDVDGRVTPAERRSLVRTV